MKPQPKVIEVTGLAKKIIETSSSQYLGISAIFAVILLSFLYLIYSGFQLTIAQGKEYQALADHNSVGKIVTFGERGLILDRNGVALVQNKKSYDVYVDSTQANQETLHALLPEYKEKITDIFKDGSLGMTLLIHDAEKSIVVMLKEKNPEGVVLRHSYLREYVSPKPFAHLLGYTGIASENDLKNNTTLVRNQMVGKSGIEYQYDQNLQGELRYETYEKDAFGNQIGQIQDTAPQAGETITLSIYKKYQENLYAVLKKAVDNNKAKGGSGVLIDIWTGEILALVSYPSYDPNLFVKGISQKDYASLIQSPQTPLLNRPIAAQEPPGSTFKTIVAAAALDSGTIDENTKFLAPGVIKLAGGFPFQDYRKRYNGYLTVREALMVSSNIFFCRTIIKLGIDKLIPYTETFGIGKKTGIDLPGEMAGRTPSPENKIWLAKNGATWLDPIWYPEGDSCNSAIGQGIALATPLQMANVAAAIANGGTLYKPRLVTSIKNAKGQVTTKQPVILSKDIASEQTLKVVREGMRMSVSGSRGVVTALKYVPMSVAAKTGTAEFGVKDKNGYSTAHAWVIGFYPYEQPKYAFAMLVEGGGTSSVASFAMRDFLNMTK